MGGSSKAQTVGYRYHLGMHLALCHGEVDALTKISIEDKILWKGEQSESGQISVSKKDLFGGESREGGVSGELDVMMGERTQGVNDYLQSKLGDVPAFRGVMSIVLRRMYIGNNPYLKPWKFRVRRAKKRQNGLPQWYADKVLINEHHMNPAHIIRECLTDPDWGMGYNDADIDNAAFKRCADALYSEGFGLSLLWDKSTELQGFIETVIKHIDAALYVDRKTGLFTLKLTRDDYDSNDLQTIDESHIIDIKDFLRPSLGELTNEVTVKFWNFDTGEEDSVTVQDIALIQQQGVVSATVNYPGIADSKLASRVAARDLLSLSTPLVACSLTCDRRIAGDLNIGDVVKLTYADYGVQELVMRVGNARYGTATNNEVQLDLLQDVFTLSEEVYVDTPPTEWQPPQNVPVASPHRLLIDAPYYELAQRLGDKEAQALDDVDAFVIVAAERPTSDAINADIYVAKGSTFSEAGMLDFCPTGAIASDLDYLTDTVTLSGVDIDLINVGTHMQIGVGDMQEIVLIQSINNNVLTIGRGCLDTLPHKHTAGTRWWAFDVYGASDNEKHIMSESVSVKITPVTSRGRLSLDDAPLDSVTLTNRHARPYPPANVKINGEHYPETIVGDFTITWATRNRLQQTAGLNSWTEGDITSENGVTYHLKITETSQTGAVTVAVDTNVGAVTSYTHPANVDAAKYAVELYSERDGLVSMQVFIHDVAIE